MVTFSNSLKSFVRIAASTAVFLFYAESIQAQMSESAEPPRDIPSPMEWFSQLEPQLWLNSPGIVHSIHFHVKKAGSQLFTRMEALAEGLNETSFIRFIPKRDFQFARRLGELPNAPRPDAKAIYRGSYPVKLWMDVKSSRVFVYQLNNGVRTKLADWDYDQSILQDKKTLLNWLKEQMHYDAVVLDVKETYVLAALLARRETVDQAIVVATSEKKLLLSAKDRKAQAILQALKVEGDFVVFEKLVATDEADVIQVGSKIIIGSEASRSSKTDSQMKAAPSSPPIGSPDSGGEKKD